ncbi:MAG: hypothetical protein ACP5JK_01865 [Candidatus Aenigmatarchaeota archaeon]
MSYKIGVSSGWWRIARSEELLGLARKIGSTATYGVNFVQLDFESIAEFQEPEVVKNIKRMITTLQIDWGIHGEIGEMMALESALEVVWNHSHRRLHQYLDSIFYKFFVEENLGEYVPKYLLFHASNLPTIAMIVERFRYAGQLTVDIYGNTNWISFIEKEEKLKKWIENSDLLYILIARESALGFRNVEDVKNHVINAIREKYAREMEKRIQQLINEGKSKDEAVEILEREIEEEIKNNLPLHAWEFFKEVTKIRFVEGAITYEDIAYLIVARYLFEKRNDPKEPLWKMFFPEFTEEDGWEKLEKNFKIKFFDKEKGEVRLPSEIVAIVSARYILGHFSQKNKEEFIAEGKKVFLTNEEEKNKEMEEFMNKTPFEKIIEINRRISRKKGEGIYFRVVFENPEITREGEEGLQRLIHFSDIYRMVKAAHMIAGFPCLGIVFDQEHYLHNNLDPLKEIEDIKKITNDVGDYLLVFHVGAPKPYHPAHEPIDIGSEAQYWIYKYAYELRKLGFGKNREGIFIFERGGARGGQVPAQFIGQSAAALRIIVEYLEKNVEPEKLPPDFYGVSSREILSEERQLAIIKEHFFDPLKGMLQVPEEEYTFLGEKAIEKGKRPEEWKKEELR